MIHDLVSKVRSLPGCRVFEPAGIPQIDASKHVLPADVLAFYTICGGLVLFENDDYVVNIVAPSEFQLSNPLIVGELYEGEFSSSWYVVCNDGSDEYLTIDLAEKRLGKCYDSFYDRHAMVGDSQIIATSFTDLLERLIENNGRHWYWLRDDFISLGDAYDV